MLIIRRILEIVCILTFFGCTHSNSINNNLNIHIIDSFIYMPDKGESGFAELQCTLVFDNRSNENVYVEFDSWLREQKDSLLLEVVTFCENSNDSVSLPLTYITSPIIYLDAMSNDTIALKADFRLLDDYLSNCLDVSGIGEAITKFKPLSIYYMSNRQIKILDNKGKSYLPVTRFSIEI